MKLMCTWLQLGNENYWDILEYLSEKLENMKFTYFNLKIYKFFQI